MYPLGIGFQKGIHDEKGNFLKDSWCICLGPKDCTVCRMMNRECMFYLLVQDNDL